MGIPWTGCYVSPWSLILVSFFVDKSETREIWLDEGFYAVLVKCPIKEMSVNGRRQARLHTNIHCLYNWIFINNFSEQSLPEQNARQDNNKSLTTSGRLRELETNPLIILKLKWTQCTEHYKRWKIGRLWDRGNSQTHRWNPLNWGGPSLEEESKVGSGCGWAGPVIR